MGFQSTVNNQQGCGIVGEFAVSSPQRVQVMTLNAVDPANNVFGRGFSKLSQGFAREGNTGVNTLPFAGILVNPKGQPLYGDGVNPLNPSLTLPDYVNAEFATEGFVWAYFTKATAPNYNDYISYNNTTGILSATTPGTVQPAGTSFAFGVVDYFQPPVLISGTTYLGVIQLTPTLVIPATS